MASNPPSALTHASPSGEGAGATSSAVPKVVAVAAGLAALLPWVSAGVALLAGIVVALTLGNPWPGRTRPLAHRALAWSVVGLGAGMNLAQVARVGIHGFGYTAVGIGAALLVGTFLGRRLRVSPDTSLLVSVGTAVCGGSAIAAIAPVLRAKDHDVSIALVTIFLLNGIALWVFPFVGHALNLGQGAFGLWCALAIHDTSSVVGAASQYGPQALEVATAAKLARALWIVPLTFGVAFVRARTVTGERAARSKPKLPWFIAWFLVVAALVTFVPALHGPGAIVSTLAHRALSLTLYLIGLGLTRSALRAVGIRPLVQATVLWLFLAASWLAAVGAGWID